MTGTFALLVRSLRMDARLLRSHLFRLVFVGLIYFALVSTQQQSVFFGAPGLLFFQWIAWLNAIMLTVVGISFFATVITEEKEEETLGLLRMAGISPIGLLLGKSVPRLVAAVVLLSVQLPFTFLAITLGGVTMHQILAVYTSLMAYTVFLSGLGLVWSVASATSRSACRRMAIVVIALFIIPPPLALFGLGRSANIVAARIGDAAAQLMEVSPFVRIGEAMQTGFAEPLFDMQVVTHLVLAAALYAVAWWLFGVLIRYDRPAAPERGLLFRRTSRLRRLGTNRAWANALAWKDFHFVAGGKPALLFKFVFYGALLVLLFWLFSSRILGPPQFGREELGGMMMVTMGIALLVEPALLAARVFHVELKWHTLPNLMMLPQTPLSVAWSKAAGCLLGITPALTYFVLGAIIYPDGVAEFLDETIDEPGAWFAGVQYLFFLHLVALLSLSLKWGALPLAFVIVYPVGWFLISMLMIGARGGDPEGFFAVLAFLGAFAVAGMHGAVIVRLQSAGAR